MYVLSISSDACVSFKTKATAYANNQNHWLENIY